MDANELLVNELLANEWLVIVDKFLAEDTKISEKESFQSSSYDELLEEINSIQSIRESTKKMMNMKRIHPFLTGMEQFEKVLVKIKFKHVAKVMACVWGPARFLLEFANRTDRELDNLLDAYEKIGNKLPLLYNYTRLFIALPECATVLVHIYQDVMTFHQLTYKLFSLRSSLFQKIYKPTWKALNNNFDHLACSLEKHGKFMEENGLLFEDPELTLESDVELHPLESSVNSTQEWEGVRRKFSEYVYNAKRFQDEFENKETTEKNDTKKRILNWISASKKTQLLHKKFQDTRICPDTGRWLFKRYSEVSDWMKEDPPPDSVLWLQGSRGFGKTVLASLLIDELGDLRTEKKKYAIPQESKIFYFYCQEEDSDHRTYIEILKGILHQMVDSTEYLLPLCKESIDSSGNLTDIATAESLIKAFFEYNTRQYIVIDGIDECELIEARNAVEFFMKQVEKCDNDIKQGQLRVLFMSQPIRELAKYMPQEDACIQLKSIDNAEDIRSYVRKRLPDFSEERATRSGFNLSESDKDQIESTICRRSEEMFLYAHLAIEYLLQQPTKEKVIEKMKEEMAPKELSQIYEKLLGIVKAKLLELSEGEAHWNMAKLLLGWLVCAKRPLKWHEMQSILSYVPTEQKVDFDNKMLRQDSNKYLGSLVHVLEGGHIRIVHSTARRYIIQNQYIDEQAVHCELAVLCLRYLCLISSSRHYRENERREKVKLGWFSFQDYACSQWHSHISTVISKCSDLFHHTNHGQSYRDMFGSALQEFMSQNGDGLTKDLHRDFRNQMPTELARFSDLTFYQNLCTLWNHIYSHQKNTFDIRNTVGIPGIENAMLENRKTLENNFTAASVTCVKDTIADYYGPNLFKCRRLLCNFFYVGYDKKEDREAHNNRHDRPYQCSLRCNAAPIGFSKKKDLERHMRSYHPGLNNEPSAFKFIHPKTSTREFPCTICSKKFTRKITQIGHERSHFGERPAKCTYMNCDKAFARKSDRNRHEKIHSRRVR
ncbi:hypothetical protein V8C42DRAFT_331337 [Trichoderma barbatum]